VLYAFYQTHGGDPIKAGLLTKADQILPYFVINELPRGLPGVLIAAIYAASMSTISAGINALTTATIVDILPRIGVKVPKEDAKQIRWAKYMTVAYGAIVLGMAFAVGRLGPLVEASNKVVGLVGGPLLGIFMLGVMSKRATTLGVWIGWAAGLAALVPITYLTKVSFMWYAAIGCMVTIVVAEIVSRLVKGKVGSVRMEE
jgi:Na+/proline symporter